MREQLARAVPGVTVHAGSAEEIPLADGCVNAVLVAQAWHWVDRSRAVPEVARVLVPGGRLGLVWNIRDEREDWVAELGRILHDPGEHRSQDRGLIGPPFGPVERCDVEWEHRLSRDELIDLAASRSYVITMPDEQRAAVLAAVRRLAGTHPGLAGSDELVLPYVTECFRAALALSRAGSAAGVPECRAACPVRQAYRDSVIMLDRSAYRDCVIRDGLAAARTRLRHPRTRGIRRRPLGTLEFVVVDVETTGWSPDADGITEIGAVRLQRRADLRGVRRPGQPGPGHPAGHRRADRHQRRHGRASLRPVGAVLPGFLDFARGACSPRTTRRSTSASSARRVPVPGCAGRPRRCWTRSRWPGCC